MEPTENQIIVIDEDGVEYAMEILFTYDNEDRGYKYVLCYENEKPEDVLAFRYDEDSKGLTEVTDDEELDEVEEMLNTFMDDPEIIKNGMQIKPKDE